MKPYPLGIALALSFTALAHAQAPRNAKPFIAQLALPFNFCSADAHPVEAMVLVETKNPVTESDVIALAKGTNSLRSRMETVLRGMINQRHEMDVVQKNMNGLMDEMNKSVKGDLGRTIAVWYDILARHKLEETCPPAL